jgi:serine/threonine protein kinase
LEYTESTNLWKPILIDFSLAKPIHAALWGYYDDDDECEDDCSFYYNLEHLVHTGEVGTVAYTAPEILAQDDDEPSYYGKPADVYSVGIVLLELIRNHIFTAHKVNAAKIQIQQAVQELPSDTPFANLVRSMIQTDPSLRPTAQQAMSHELFPKFGFIQDPSTNHPIVRIATALPHGDDDEAEEEEEENEPPNESVVPHCKQRVEHVKIHKEEEKRKTKRLQLIDKILHALGTEHPWTRSAAYEYSIRFQEIDDADEMNQVLEPRRNNKGNKTTTTTTTQSLLDCCILAHKFWELELLDYPQLPHDQPTLFADWSYETYIDNEATIFMLMDYCLYPRTLLLPSKGTK